MSGPRPLGCTWCGHHPLSIGYQPDEAPWSEGMELAGFECPACGAGWDASGVQTSGPSVPRGRWMPEGAGLLRALGLYGKHISTERPRTPLEEAAYGGPGVEGGSGLLVGWAVDDRTVTHGDQSETWEQVPFVAVDWGMCWGLLPGTTVTIRDATDTEAAALAEAGLA